MMRHRVLETCSNYWLNAGRALERAEVGMKERSLVE
jgi:hypothetical protein